MARIHFAIVIMVAFMALPATAAPTSGMGKTATGGGHGGGIAIGFGSGRGGHASEDPTQADPTVTGALAADDVKKLAHRNRQQLVYCIEVSRTREPALAGTVRVAFTIGPDGHVKDAAVKPNDTKSADLAQCVLLRFKFWTFPKPKDVGTAKVEYPIVFAPAPARR